MQLHKLAKQVLYSDNDKKWSELSNLLQTNAHFMNHEKFIIFTEQRDTLVCLQEKISSLLWSDDIIVTIHGGLTRNQRLNV